MAVSLTLIFYFNRSAVKSFAHTRKFLNLSEDKSFAPFF